MFGWFKQDKDTQFARAVYGLNRGFPYKSEKYEILFSVPMCITRGGGDCDDKADMWHCVLKAMGFDPKVVHGYYGRTNHAAVICRIGQKEFVFCNAARKVMESQYYLKNKMRNYKILTDKEYKEWRLSHAVDRV